MLNAMAQNGGDADYMAAFFCQLGPAGLYGLSLYAQGGRAATRTTSRKCRRSSASGLATASFEMPLTMKFLQGIEPDNPPPGYSTEMLPAAGTPGRSRRSSPRASSATSG